MRPLAGRDAQVLQLLAQVVAIGRNRKSFTAPDVVRVAHDHLHHPHTLQRRLRAAEQEIARLQAHLRASSGGDVDELPPRRIVELNRSEYEVFALFCEGQTRAAIARELGLSVGTVTNSVSRVADRLGADSPGQAAALVNRRIVALQASGRRTKVSGRVA